MARSAERATAEADPTSSELVRAVAAAREKLERAIADIREWSITQRRLISLDRGTSSSR